jgi:prepilin-type N-terminal cleavage/methylation domain-containing protein/prepilin-type processing-associated H-X9-DG protein
MLRKAFTLIELLVVISIIALLMAVLLPALRNAKLQATSIVCRTQLKDIGLAFNLYVQDHNREMPTSNEGGTGRWVGKIGLYYEESKRFVQGGGSPDSTVYLDMFRCPTQKKKFDSIAVGTYGYNLYMTGGNGDDGTIYPKYNWRKSDRYIMPSQLPVMGCLSGEIIPALPTTTNGGGLHMYPNAGPHPVALEYGYDGGTLSRGTKVHYNGPAAVHKGKCNFLFADFHVDNVDVCDKSQWPWFDKFDGKPFHPIRKPGAEAH